MKKILFVLLFVLLGITQVSAQNTSSYFETIDPFNQTNVYLPERETINLFVEVNDSGVDISNLEIVITNENLNNYSFLFYPNQTNPHPSQGSTGISASYSSNNQSWNIDLGSTISSYIVDQFKTTLTYIIKDSLNQTTYKNTTQNFYSDSRLPEIQQILPTDSSVYVNKNSGFTYTLDIFEEVRKNNTLKSAKFRYDSTNNTLNYNISISDTPLQFPNLNVSFNYSNQYLNFEFSKNLTRNFINNSAIFYIELEDEAGNTYGSVENLTSRQTPNDFKYVNEYFFQEDSISPHIMEKEPTKKTFSLAEKELFKYTFQVNETNLAQVQFNMTGATYNTSFILYPNQINPVEYEGNTKGFVNASYNSTAQEFNVVFDEQTTTNFLKKENVSITLQAQDKASNTQKFVKNITITRDSFSPQLDMFYSFKDNIVLDNKENFTLVVNAYDKTKNLDSLKLKYDVNKTTIITEFTTNTSNYNSKTQSWMIEFNESTTKKFVDQEFVTFFIEINDGVGNSFGSINKSLKDASKTYSISRLTNSTYKTNEIVSTSNTTLVFDSGFKLENIENRSTGQIKIFTQNPSYSAALENEVLVIADIIAVVPKTATLSYPLVKVRGYENLEFYVWNSTNWNLCPTIAQTPTHLTCNTSSFSTWAITGNEIVTPPSGGGGGNSQDEDTQVFEFNINSISFDETLDLGVGNQIELEFRGRIFTVEIEEIEDEITFNVQGLVFSLEQGDTRRFDLTGNNQEDIEVEVVEIDSSIAQVRLQRIREEIEVIETTTQESSTEEETTVQEESTPQIPDEESSDSSLDTTQDVQRTSDNALTGYITQNIPTFTGALSGIVLISLIVGGAYFFRRRP